MTDRYCVFGNPIGHSKSPAIHAAFAAATGQDLTYEARLASIDAADGFAAAVQAFVAEGGRGANVTVPFKEDAYRLAGAPGNRLTPRAQLAGAVNTLAFGMDGVPVLGDNTDGVGLVRDLTDFLGVSLAGKRILLLGAGGAARGALGPLLDAGPAELAIANRTVAKAQTLVELVAASHPRAQVSACAFADLAGRRFDVVINATSASLQGEPVPLPAGLYAPGGVAYDMMYGADTPFLAQARQLGAAICADGLGMLVEQAAEAFALWRGVRPDTAAVRRLLRPA